MGYSTRAMYYGGMDATSNMGMPETGSPVDWVLIGVIVGSIVLGIVMGIILGKKAMNKRDI